MVEFIAAHQATIIGIIFMLVIGPAIGNYACSVVYRLPRKIPIFERHPFCGHCGAALKPIDLFPIISWVRQRGKCRYCGGGIPSIYTVIELACGTVFIAYFLHFGVSEPFILYAGFASFAIMLAAIQWQHGLVSPTIYAGALGFIALARTLNEHTIYGFLQSGFVMFVVMVGIMRAGGSKASPFSKPWVMWFTLMGALVPMAMWKFILPIYALKLMVPKETRLIVYIICALALPMFLPTLLSS